MTRSEIEEIFRVALEYFEMTDDSRRLSRKEEREILLALGIKLLMGFLVNVSRVSDALERLADLETKKD